MKLEDGRVYCLPDGYEVVDRSLDVIRFVLNPTFTDAEVLLKPPSATIRPTLRTAPVQQGGLSVPAAVLHSAFSCDILATMAAASERPRKVHVDCALPTVGG